MTVAFLQGAIGGAASATGNAIGQSFTILRHGKSFECDFSWSSLAMSTIGGTVGGAFSGAFGLAMLEAGMSRITALFTTNFLASEFSVLADLAGAEIADRQQAGAR